MKKTLAGLWLVALAVLNLVWLWLTSARWVGWVDSGELAAACSSLGVAHPTGYPIYTLLTRVAYLLLPGSPIEASVAISCIPMIAAGIWLVLILRHFATGTT